MADREVELAIRATADASDVIDSFADIQAAARKLDAGDVDDFVREANRSLDGFKDGLDGIAGTASQTAGGLGDLAGGLELVGLNGAAEKLNQVATATQAVAGVADLATVATNLLSASKIKDTAATVGNRVATVASSAATKAAAAAQWALNAALSANPLGLIILAVVALVAGFVLLYKKSDTFRAIVQKVGEVGKAALGFLVDKAGELVKWIKDKLPGAFNKLKQIAVFAINHIPIVWIIRKAIELAGWVKDKLPGAWNTFKDYAVRAFNAIPIVFLIRKAGDVFDWFKRRIPGAWQTFQDKAIEVFDAVTAPIEALIDFVKDLVDAIGNISWPEPPDWVSDLGDSIGDLFGGKTTAFVGTLTPAGPTPFDPRGAVPVSTETINVKVTGAIDPEGTAAAIETMLERRRKRFGR